MKPRGFEFEEVLTVDPSKSWFDMSYKNKFTANFGKLYPFYVEETMPGDKFKINSTVFARLQPLLAPVMQQCDIFSYFFYVANRLVWNNWKKFQSKGDGSVKMKDAASYVPPAHPVFRPGAAFAGLVNNNSAYKWSFHHESPSPDYYFGVVHSGSSTFDVSREELMKLVEIYDYMGIPFNIADTAGGSANTNNYIMVCTLSGSTYTVIKSLSSFGLPPGSTFTYDGSTGVIAYDTSGATVNTDINVLPFYAYNKIYNEFFRSQDYMNELFDEASDGLNYQFSVGESLHFELLSKCFEHDYFTSILPDCQRGPDVTLSLAGTAPLINDTTNFSAHPTQVRGAGATTQQALSKMNGNNNVQDATGAAVQLDVTPHTKVDLSGVSAITINALRYANTLQKYEEALARSGSRYNEMLLALFGVESSDASIQRPIFLGASRTPVTINDVAQTSSTTGADALGQLAGRGIAVGDVNTEFYCEENGWIIGVLSIVPRTQYFQGLSRHLRKTVDLDYPVPLFAHLGEQEVYKEELYFGSDSHDREILGYLPRFSEFKYHSDEIHGELKQSLNFWTMSRKIAPGVNGAIVDADFLKADTMSYDAFAVTDPSVDHFILDVTNNVALLRSLPEYSTPLL